MQAGSVRLRAAHICSLSFPVFTRRGCHISRGVVPKGGYWPGGRYNIRLGTERNEAQLRDEAGTGTL